MKVQGITYLGTEWLVFRRALVLDSSMKSTQGDELRGSIGYRREGLLRQYVSLSFPRG
jgi:hypothetical protein